MILGAIYDALQFKSDSNHTHTLISNNLTIDGPLKVDGDLKSSSYNGDSIFLSCTMPERANDSRIFHYMQK